MFTPIAIVGQACLLPGADSPEQLWRVIRERRTTISPVPQGRWRASRERMLSGGMCASDAGGFIDGFDHVDDDLDPLVHWLLQVGRRALESAGIEEGNRKDHIGAIVGNLAYPTEALVDLAQSIYLPDAPGRKRGPLNRFSAGLPVHLLCRALELKAGGYAIDAACASSLYAIKLASDWLRTRRADVMLAGAVNRVEGLLIHSGFTALRALSPSGRSRPFHRDADGLVPAEGAALLVLKRLADAEADGDRILGVIRAIGLSNDGRGSGFLAPSVEGQVRAMEAAYTQSGLHPRDVSLIECHATGTGIGDSVELQSMSKVFRGCRDIPIGSLKSNLGHLITVSGAAGIIKVLQALRHQVRPSTLNASPSTRTLEGTPFRLLEMEESWERDSGEPRRAAINSFGFGGNNAHLLLEEYLPDTRYPEVASVPRSAVAVVGLAARAGDGRSTNDFVSDFLTGRSRIRSLPSGTRAAPAKDIHLPATGLIFPPLDLARALAQQNLMLEVAAEALEELKPLPAETTSVLIGMACDVESTRTVLRLALPDLLGPSFGDADHLRRIEDAMDAPIDAARVVGCMPNIPANRLNRQFGLGAASFTIAAEELSGIRALDIAINALVSGEIDAAIVGASDLCVEPVHCSTVDELPEDKRIPGDGACVLVLKRLDDAIRDSDPIRSIVDMPKDGSSTLDDPGIGRRVRECFGHIHAASGLLEVVAAVAAFERATMPAVSESASVPLLPGASPHRLRIDSTALGGQSATVTVTKPNRSIARDRVFPPVITVPSILTYTAEDIGALRRAVESNEPSPPLETRDAEYRLAIVATETELSERVNQARSYLRRFEQGDRSAPPEGVFFHRERIDGELAFVFTGAAAAYSGIGRDLVLALPALVGRVSDRCRDIDRYAGWIYPNPRRDPRDVEPNDFQKLCGSSFLSQVHYEFTRWVLRLQPQAAIGLSSGETNALYAFGAWDNMHELLRDVEECGLYTTVLGGRAEAVHQFWAEQKITGTRWTSYWISAPLKDVEAAVRDEPAVHITIINSASDVVIGGEVEACQRVVARIGSHLAAPMGTDLAAHCPEAGPAAALWRRLHHRPTVEPDGIRFYSNALGRSYALNADAVADALTQQALVTIDFPRTIRQAWDDGVRVFIEHGPRGQCTQSVRTILGNLPHVAVALDNPSRSALRQALSAAAELWAAGVAVDLRHLRNQLGIDIPRVTERAGMLVFPAHPPAPLSSTAAEVFVMKPAPKLAPLLSGVTSRSVSATGNLQAAAAVHARMSEAHRVHLSQMTHLDQAYQELQSRLVQTLSVSVNPRRVSKRSFTRTEIEVHASGLISSVFGDVFTAQDGYRRQVRMPAPPLLLADRVIALTGEPGSMGQGSITTESDVTADSWYLHQGRMPAGLAIEAGQADLMLISWLGVDALNQGKRVYRLLGCDLSFSGGLPRVGDTLRYDIQVDSHASHGDVRIFFFHYDCTIGGKTRLTVRNGQAGFFSDEELAASEGVLWSAEMAEPTPQGEARQDPPFRLTTHRSFNEERTRAFGEGRMADCFGVGFEHAFTHTRSPRIQDGRMQLLQNISAFDPSGGPWGRGYLRAEWKVRKDDWFFEGHFKNDPCMPGTLMFEGCLQAMAFHMGALGFLLEHDGGRFEPVPDEFFALRCRGQVLPSSRLLTYEIFVDEVIGGSLPTLYADVLCTVDGLKAFHCRRLGLRLVPDWPLEEMEEMEELRTGRSANVPFDQPSLMACALGRPSNAFGPAFARFDGPAKVPRLPAPPYHFMSRVTRTEGRDSIVGAVAEVEYDVPSDAWYFAENGHPVMPASVLMEVLLQPCGWLASFAGTWLDVSEDIFFRNLDGSGTVHSEIGPKSGTIRTRATLTSFSQIGTMSITAFKIVCHAGDRIVFDGDAVFGHFPAQALENQTGLAASDDELRWFAEPSQTKIDLEVLKGPPFLGRDKLRMIDRITGYWPAGGAAGLGRMRAEKDIDPRQWFFKAHFFTDPVQPGSLGLEAVLQTLQIYMLASGCHQRLRNPRFEPIELGARVSWTYRGQVLPANRVVTILLEVVERGHDARGVFTKAIASLWVDGTKIYTIPNLGMRMVETEGAGDTEILDPARDTWLRDHCPTYTVPVLPMMSVVDRLAAAAQQSAPHRRVLELRDIRLNGWIAFGSGARRFKTKVLAHDGENVSVTLFVWRDAPHGEMSRYDAMAQAEVRLGDQYPPPPLPMLPLRDVFLVHDPPAHNIYEDGELFHGAGFHFLKKLWRSKDGASFLLDAGAGAVPVGFLNQGLFDGITHGIPNENLRQWSERIPFDQVGYPSRIIRLSLFADPPADGQSSCEVRFTGFHEDEDRFPQFAVQLTTGGHVWAEMELVYALFNKGPLGMAPGAQRRRFLQEKTYVPGLMLGTYNDGVTRLSAWDLHQSDWLPGTLDCAFDLTGPDRVLNLAIKQHVARSAQVHPADVHVAVRVSEHGGSALCRSYPLTRFPVEVGHDGDITTVRDAGPPHIDCDIVRSFWAEVSGVAEWPIADLYIGLIERFVRRVELTDPDGFAALRGKPAMFLGNHQVAVESILFNVIVSALSEVPIKVVAKIEHRKTWIGQLIELTRRYPNARQPEPILFFDRANALSLFDLFNEFRAAQAEGPASLMVHVDGTRARSCRTPVAHVSSVLLDLALELNLCIVPVRFTGGLPVETLAEPLEFPIDFGRQDIRIGSPILPDTLLGLPLAERSRLVIQAINNLAPEDEHPLPPGASSGNVLLESLRSATRRCAETEKVLAAVDGAPNRGLWLDEFAAWLGK